ncbi:unnamed protein product [Moneuplotes crassus]|uniref:Uncharacterized protein n=1 Tax=Euplotes crassus TaxID=5936 RepID=A0AAD1X715_EUPCR|nr:unnamed protein product [Moneuplotes crassus]
MSIPLNEPGQEMDINIEHPCQIFSILLKHDILGRMLFLCYMRFNNKMRCETTSEKLLQALFDSCTEITKLMLQRQKYEYKYGVTRAYRRVYNEEDKKKFIESLHKIMEVYDFPDDMLQGRAAYALNMIITAMKEQMTKDSYNILAQRGDILTGSKLDQAVIEEMDQYFCDLDKAVSCCYQFTIKKDEGIKKFTKMTPYIIDFKETTTDFYTNVRNSVISQVAPAIKQEKGFSNYPNIEDHLTLKINHYPQMIILSSALIEGTDCLFKLVPQEFDLSKVNSPVAQEETQDFEIVEEEKIGDDEEEIIGQDEEEKIGHDQEENKQEDQEGVSLGTTIYEMRNLISMNERNQFFDMINHDDGDWSGYAQERNFDYQKYTFIKHKIPDNDVPVLPIDELKNLDNIQKNDIFMKLKPLMLIYMKKDQFTNNFDKYISDEASVTNTFSNDDTMSSDNDAEIARKLQKQLNGKQSKEPNPKSLLQKINDYSMHRADSLRWKCRFCDKVQETYTACFDCGKNKSFCIAEEDD